MRKRIVSLLTIIVPLIVLSASEKSYAHTRVNINLFYSSLAPYGVWFEYGNYGLCWRPTVVGVGWRPYTRGHWVWTEYGWTWVSDYVWGWAPFHYGRWLYDDYYGWIWVPDDVWGPAWVEWRISDTYIGWAPLPPDARFQVNVRIPVGGYSIPHFWWSFTYSHNFLGPRIVLLPVTRNVVLFRETRSVHGIRFRGRKIYNEEPAVDFVERISGGRIQRAAVVEDRDFGQRRGNRLEGDRLYVYRPENVRQNDDGAALELRRERPQNGRNRFSKGEGERERFERRRDRELQDSRRSEYDVRDRLRTEREFRSNDRERWHFDREFSSGSKVQRERTFRAEEKNDRRGKWELRDEGRSDGLLIVIMALMAAVLPSCSLHVTSFDVTPPAAPRQIQTFAGDNFVEVWWVENTEWDLAGYNVYVALDPRGNFRLVGSTRSPEFVDEDVVNGRSYYYAVSAFDFDGNESNLSVDPLGVTPRPQGRNVTLFDYRSTPTRAGYDFSTYTVGPYNDKYTDIFFEYSNGIAYMNVWDDSDIQDMGYTASLDEIRLAPEKGWSPTGDVRLITGHTYVVWTWDDHYAKFRVTSVTPQRVVFDWAYQLQKGNPFLKRKRDSDRAPLSRARGRSE